MPRSSVSDAAQAVKSAQSGQSTRLNKFSHEESSAAGWFYARLKGVFLLALMAVAVFLILSLVTYHLSDLGWSSSRSSVQANLQVNTHMSAHMHGVDSGGKALIQTLNVRGVDSGSSGSSGSSDSSGSSGSQILNSGGRFGAILADAIFSFLGFFGYALPILIFVWVGVIYIQSKEQLYNHRHWYWMHIVQILGMVLILLAGSGICQYGLSAEAMRLPQASGGILGQLVWGSLFLKLNILGTLLVLLFSLLAGWTLLCGLHWIESAKKLFLFLNSQLHKNLTALGTGIKKFLIYLLGKISIKFSAYWSERALKKQQRKEALLAQKALLLAAKEHEVRNNKNNLSDLDSDSDSAFSYQDHRGLMSVSDKEVSDGLSTDLSTDFSGDFSSNFLNENFGDPFVSHGEQMGIGIPNPSLSRVKPEKGEALSTGISTGPDVEGLDHEKNILNKIKTESKTESKIFEKLKKNKKSFRGKLPSLELLDNPEERAISVSEQALAHMACLLEEKLVDFGITAKVVGVCPGPVVTRYELQLAPGMKVSKLSNLSKDLARSLSAISVRIVEVIPGKSVVGIEIPNEKRQMVRLKEVLKSKAFLQSKSPLTMGLGKDISGEPEVLTLEKMPHLLVAGTTGSGKSVGLNAMLLSMLLKATPDELRLIMIDPKMLELSIYEGVPHLLTPVVTDMKEAANALRWCVKEMDRRYRLMAALAVRNLAGYNQKVQQALEDKKPIEDPIFKQLNPGITTDVPILETMPYIVVFVDEFADMMMVVGKKVEELIARLAQKARAAGIHLILATQRPSVDVITGLIKANIPTRMAFQVSSKIDSRTILDQQGAEQLLGHGDMLYLPPGAGVPIRVHGAFVADHEVQSVVEAWKSLGEPDYIENILQTTSSDDAALGESSEEEYEQDPLYDEAVNLVMETGRASISMVQRRLKIGYNRSARLLEAMEAAGLVSAIQPNGMRELLVNRAE